jgi:predicted ester cyclase
MVDAIIAKDGDAVCCQVMIYGHTRKRFCGIPNKGNYFESDHIFIFHLNDAGKIDSIEIEWDHADLKRQLGAT